MKSIFMKALKLAANTMNVADGAGLELSVSFRYGVEINITVLNLLNLKSHLKNRRIREGHETNWALKDVFQLCHP